jgi:hypothetical protein
MSRIAESCLVAPLEIKNCSLLLLKEGKEGAKPSVTRVELAGPGQPPQEIYDAMAWNKGQIILGTDRGVLLYDMGSSGLSKPPFPAPAEKIRALCRDGLGRVWMAGEGLWVTDTAGKQLRDLRAASPVAPANIRILAIDSAHRDGVFTALDRRGALFLRAEEPPAP